MSYTLKDVINAIDRENAEYVANDNSPYKEIFRLEQMLKNEGIPYEMRKLLDGWQIGYPASPIKKDNSQKTVCSVIQHFGSYGAQDDLLEIMGLTQNGQAVEGFLSAEEVLNRILLHYQGCNSQQ